MHQCQCDCSRRQYDKQEVHGPHRSPEKPALINEYIWAKLWLHIIISWNWTSSSGGKDFQISWMYFYNFVFISLWKKAWTFNMNKPKSSSPKDAFYHGLVEIGPVVLEKIFKFNVYSLFRTYLPLEKDGPLRLYKFEYPSPKYLIRSKFAWNLPTDSGKEDF